MFVTSLAVAGGALSVGVKVYRDRKREREFPWTVAAERMGVYPLARRKPQNRLIAMGRTAKLGLKAQQKRLFGTDRRGQQLGKLSEGREQSEMSFAEQEVDRLLALSTGSLVLTRLVGSCSEYALCAGSDLSFGALFQAGQKLNLLRKTRKFIAGGFVLGSWFAGNGSLCRHEYASVVYLFQRQAAHKNRRSFNEQSAQHFFRAAP